MGGFSIFETFARTELEPPVKGYVHPAPRPGAGGLILTHGAGANCASLLLMALATAFADAGWTVLRCDLPFRQSRPYGPPGPGDAARDRKGLRNALMALRERIPGPIYLGGHSYGGRQATMLCAEEPGLVAGLLLLSYPLHPPRKPDRLRTQHFPNLQTPGLFVHGTRDPFGTVQEIEAALKLSPARSTLLPVESGHDLGFKGKSRNETLPAAVIREFQRFFDKSYA